MLIYTTTIATNKFTPRFIYLMGYDGNYQKCCVRIDFGNWIYVKVDGDDEHVRQEAMKLGLSVDKDVVRKKISNDVITTHTFLRVWGKSKKELDGLRSKVSNEIFEYGVDNTLKFYAELQIKKYCWLDIPDVERSHVPESIYQNEFICTDWSTITESSTGKDIPHWSIMSFDIEVHSTNMAKFPSADADPLNQIICVAITFKDAHQYLEEVIYWGKDISEYIDSVNRSNVKYIYVKDEIALIQYIFDFMNIYDPDVITGHNIIGFDYNFIYDRWSCLNGHVPFPETSRLRTAKSDMIKAQRGNSQFTLSYKYLKIPGRITIDTWAASLREIFGKMESNKLRYVSTKLLNTTKNEMSHIQMFKVWRHILSDAERQRCADKYVVSDESLSILYEEMMDQYNHYPTNSDNPTIESVNKLIEIRNRLNIYDQAFKPLSKIDTYDIDEENDKVWKDIQRLLPSWNLERSEKKLETAWYLVLLYCIQDTRLPISIIEVTNLLNNLREFANIVFTDITDRLLSGQGKGCENTQYYNMHKEYVLRNPGNFDDRKYEGGFVMSPDERSSGEDSIVYPLDFASLYPSIIIAYNIDPASFVSNEDLVSVVNRLADRYSMTPAKAFETFFHYWYVDDEHIYILKGEPMEGVDHRGVLPKLLINQFNSRKSIRANMASLKHDKVRYSVEDAKQLAVKVSMNSQYGKLGDSKSRYSFVTGAKLVTYIGRESIQKAIRHVNQIDGISVMYGDTDSMFIRISDVKARFDNDIKKVEAYATSLCKEVSAMFPAQMNMEVEHPFLRLYTVGKKMYCGLKYGDTFDITRYDYESAKNKGLIYFRGLKEVKSDACRFEKDVQSKIIFMILSDHSVTDIIDYLMSQVMYLFNTVVRCIISPSHTIEFAEEMEERFGFSCSYTEKASKNPTRFMKILADRLRRGYGINFEVGEKYKIIVAEFGKKDTKTGDTVTVASEFMAEKKVINWRYYLKRMNTNIERINNAFNGAFDQYMLHVRQTYDHRLNGTERRHWNLVRYFALMLTDTFA